MALCPGGNCPLELGLGSSSGFCLVPRSGPYGLVPMLPATMPSAKARSFPAFGLLVVVLGPGLAGGSCLLMNLVGMFPILICVCAWGRPALGLMVIGLGFCLVGSLGPLVGPGLLAVLSLLSVAMLVVSVARVCLLECLE